MAENNRKLKKPGPAEGLPSGQGRAKVYRHWHALNQHVHASFAPSCSAAQRCLACAESAHASACHFRTQLLFGTEMLSRNSACADRTPQSKHNTRPTVKKCNACQRDVIHKRRHQRNVMLVSTRDTRIEGGGSIVVGLRRTCSYTW